jgi:hypothetical protein
VGNIILIFLVIAAVKTVIFGVILYKVFRQDIHHWWNEDRRQKQKTPAVPTCMYCQSVWTVAVDEGSTRWDGEDLVLVTTYECQHCHLPFWHVERVPMGAAKS